MRKRRIRADGTFVIQSDHPRVSQCRAYLCSKDRTVGSPTYPSLTFFALFHSFGLQRWIYWWNPFAWAYRALLVNEFQSGSYVDGDAILTQMGFTYGPDKDIVFGQEWVMYSFAYMVPHFFLCIALTAVGLSYARRSPTNGASSKSDDKSFTAASEQRAEIESRTSRPVQIPFKRVTITFEDICYDVKASTGKEQLRLLNNVNGVFR